MTEDSIRVSPGRPTGSVGDGHGSGGPRRRGGLPIPTEAIVFAALTAAILIAAAIADNFDAPTAWTNVTLLGLAYILSRGLVKRGHGDGGAL
jgi:hypothetical protein